MGVDIPTRGQVRSMRQGSQRGRFAAVAQSPPLLP